MKIDFLLSVTIPPVVLIGLVCWLTISQTLQGAALIAAWIVALLASMAFDTWVSTRYTMKRLAQKRRDKGDDDHD